MLTVLVSATDDSDDVELTFEHSLVSLSKWESKYKKAFFGQEEKTTEEAAAYYRYMVVSDNAPTDLLNRLSRENVETINEYINDKQSATWFRDDPVSQKKSSEVVTSELIYYWLVQFRIDWEAQHWHLNRLMTLVKICGIKQTKPKAMTKQQQAEQYRRLNAERRAASGSSG